MDKTFIKNINKYSDMQTPELINHENLTENNKHAFIKSREIFCSMITMTDWYDEIKTHNTMGITINMTTNYLSKIAANNCYPNIKDIIPTYFTYKEYIELVTQEFTNNNIDDISLIKILDGNVIGKSNALIPLYINEIHWSIAKHHLEHLLGIIIAGNPLYYKDAHLNFMFSILNKMVVQTFNMHVNDTWLYAFYAVHRTCSQIAYEKGYHKGIKKIYQNIISYNNTNNINKTNNINETNNINKTNNGRPFSDLVICGQILCTFSGINTNENINTIFYDNMVRILIRSFIVKGKYDINYLTKFLYQKNDEELEEEITYLIDYINTSLSAQINILACNYQMLKLMTQVIKKCGGYQTYLKILDTSFGVANDDMLSIKDEINKLGQCNMMAIIDLQKYYEHIGVAYSDAKIIKYMIQCIIGINDDYESTLVSEILDFYKKYIK